MAEDRTLDQDGEFEDKNNEEFAGDFRLHRSGAQLYAVNVRMVEEAVLRFVLQKLQSDSFWETIFAQVNFRFCLHLLNGIRGQ